MTASPKQPDHVETPTLAHLANFVSQQAGSQCPECGQTHIEDNQGRGDDLEYRCTSCDHRWQPE